MTKHELLIKGIQAYSEAIEECKDLNLRDCKTYLKCKGLEIGFCLYAKRNGLDIWYVPWVDNYLGGISAFWAQPPKYCKSHKELIESLETRLKILQTELEITENEQA